MPAHEMLIVKKAFDFSKWLLHHTGKFPKSFRFSIAVRRSGKKPLSCFWKSTD